MGSITDELVALFCSHADRPSRTGAIPPRGIATQEITNDLGSLERVMCAAVKVRGNGGS